MSGVLTESGWPGVMSSQYQSSAFHTGMSECFSSGVFFGGVAIVRSSSCKMSDSPTRYVPQFVEPPAETPGELGQTNRATRGPYVPAPITPHGLQHIEAPERLVLQKLMPVQNGSAPVIDGPKALQPVCRWLLGQVRREHSLDLVALGKGVLGLVEAAQCRAIQRMRQRRQ